MYTCTATNHNINYEVKYFKIVLHKYISVHLPNIGGIGISATIKNQLNRKFSDSLHEIAASCVEQKPCDRPSAAQLLSYSYFKNNRKHTYLPEFLKPALPMSDRVAYNKGNELYRNWVGLF